MARNPVTTISLPAGTKLTREVREAIARKFEALENMEARSIGDMKISGRDLVVSDVVAWGITYHT